MVDGTNAAFVEIEVMHVERLQLCGLLMLRHETKGLLKK